jgi:hypothetical protein
MVMGHYPLNLETEVFDDRHPCQNHLAAFAVVSDALVVVEA